MSKSLFCRSNYHISRSVDCDTLQGQLVLGSCIVGIIVGYDLIQCIQWVRREHARSVVWFSDALIALSICVMNIYDRRRLTGIIIAQLMNMHYAEVECKSPD